MDVSRTINEHIKQEKVRLTSLEQVTENAQIGDFFASTDMRKGYYHLAINPRYRRLFGFKWKGVYYQWNCCFLGLRDLVLKFTKFFKPIITKARSEGHDADAYIDDVFVLAGSEQICEAGIGRIKVLMRKAGIVEATLVDKIGCRPGKWRKSMAS